MRRDLSCRVTTPPPSGDDSEAEPVSLAQVVVDHSMVTPQDAGRDIEFRELCSESDKQDCRYGRPTAFVWNVLVNVLRLVEFAANLCFDTGYRRCGRRFLDLERCGWRR